MTKLKLTLIASALMVSGSAIAASDGSLGNTSIGESIVTIVKDNAVQISNVNDLDLGAHAALAADAVEFDDVCVFSSTSNYNVTIDSSNGNFRLMDGTEEIPYALTWAANGGTAATVTDGTAITGLAGDNASLDCSAGTNARFEVTVASADFNAAVPGSYSDTLTLTVAPE